MKRIELAVLGGRNVSNADAYLWNKFSNFTNKYYDTLLPGEFYTYYKGTRMKAVCLKLRWKRKQDSVGFCTLKILLRKQITGTSRRHTVYNETAISRPCRAVLRRIMRLKEKRANLTTGSTANNGESETENEIGNQVERQYGDHDHRGGMEESERYYQPYSYPHSEYGSYYKPVSAQYVIYVDLRTMPCDPPEDLSLCTQYVSLLVLTFLFTYNVSHY